MNILDKEKAITLICEYIKSRQDIESIIKVKSNDFCNCLFDTHFTINEFGNYYILKYNNSKLYKEEISKDYLSFTVNNVAYKLYVSIDQNTITEVDRNIDLNLKRFGFITTKQIHYKVLVPKKNYVLKIGHYTFELNEEEYEFIMKSYDTVIKLYNEEKETIKLSNLYKENNNSITQLLKQFNI